MNSSDKAVLATDEAAMLFAEMKPFARDVLAAFNDCHFEDGGTAVNALRSKLAVARSANPHGDDCYFNDLYVLDRYIDLLSTYGELWHRITTNRFSETWCSLQDALDLLRVIKTNSDINVEFFEGQLTERERADPYDVFFSVGMLVERSDCSICGLDIDSPECPHVRGALYRGAMAHGISRGAIELDHFESSKPPVTSGVSFSTTTQAKVFNWSGLSDV
jgi:hypothetical protein